MDEIEEIKNSDWCPRIKELLIDRVHNRWMHDTVDQVKQERNEKNNNN